MSVCAVWWFDYAWDSGARLRLPSILSCGLRNRICFARKFFHQKFKVALGRAWIEIFLVQHLHNFWTTSKAGIASGCTICEHRAGELIMETLFHPLQQFHNEFRMNEPRRHWSGAEYEEKNISRAFNFFFEISCSDFFLPRAMNLSSLLWQKNAACSSLLSKEAEKSCSSGKLKASSLVHLFY